MSPLIGQTLAHYRVTAALGAGGMGEVYRATDTKLGREVALKVLPAGMAANADRLERFRREAKALASLDHPGIVTVHSVEESDGVHFLTMQLVEGQPLDKLIPESGLPVDRILEIATALAEAFATAHDKGIVHRDLKPANVMVTADGRVKGPRLRPRADERAGGAVRWLGAAHRHAHARGRRDGDGAVHVAGAGVGEATGPPDRRLLPRGLALRDGERAPTVPG